MKPAFASKIDAIKPFYVMDLLAKAQAYEQQGRSIIHLEVGEPDFRTPEPIARAATNAIAEGKTKYTPATGLPELKQKISQFYLSQKQAIVDPERIVITPGASGALLLVLGALLELGDKIVVCDPGYPCNRNFAGLFNAQVISIPVAEADNYCLTCEQLAAYWEDGIKAVLLASPANPTGAVISDQRLRELHQFIQQRGSLLIVDEIYNGLVYQSGFSTAATIGDEIVVINSFSKYFCMTGWRLGWVIVPPGWLSIIDKLAQNIFLSPPTVSQYAALAAFDQETLEVLETRRQCFAERLDFLYPQLQRMGFVINRKPAGAFYIYCNCSGVTDDSYHFAGDLLDKTGVAITPGRDFGDYQQQQHIRFCFTQDIEQITEAVSRIGAYLEL